MELLAEVTAGKTMGAGETLDNEKLNQIAVPLVAITGDVTADIARAGAYWYGIDSGAANALIVTLDPAPTAYVDGMVVSCSVAVTVNGAATINVNGLGARGIKKGSGVDLVGGDLRAGQRITLIYDSALAAFRLVSPLAFTTVSVTAAGRNVVVKSNAGTPNSKVDIAADELVLKDSNANAMLVAVNLAGIDITASGANGLDTGAEAVSTWYYMWVIFNATTPAVAGLLSASSSAPTLPAGYTHKALVGAVRNDAGSNFVKFWGSGKTVWQAEQAVITATAAAAPATYENLALTAFVPPIAKAVFGNAGSSNGTASQLIIAGDLNGVGACVVACPTSAVTTDGFLSGGPYLVPLMVAQQLTWQATDGTAHNRISVSGYEIG